jgi:hypothetical protein
MNSPLFRKNLLPLALLLAASVFLLLPEAGLSSGEIPLNKGAVLQITDFDDSSTAGPDPSLFSRKYSGAAKSDPSLKTLRAMAKASPGSKASYQAWMATLFTIQKGHNGSSRGKARITLYGLSYDGVVITPRAAAGKSQLKMTVSSAADRTGTELILLTASGNGASPKIYQKDRTEGSVEIQVAAGDTFVVALELVVSAGTGTQDFPAEVDFYSKENKVRFEGVRVEILNTETPLPIVTPLPDQVFLYDNPRCLNLSLSSCLIVNKGEQIEDLSRVPLTEGLPDTWNDRINCLKMGANVNRVIVYQHPGFKGRSRTYTRTGPNPGGVWSLQGSGWDRTVSSIVVE